MRKMLAAGNWKMNGLQASLAEATALADAASEATAEVLLCPPATLLAPMAAAVAGSKVAVGGQDCHAATSGAHTGDISAQMIADAGGTFAIVGHSERRADHGESNDVVKAKAEAAHGAGLVAIVCIGETLEEREAGQALAVTGAQLAGSLPEGANGANTVVAYEPVWAIGTGKTASTADIAEIHDALRAALEASFGDEGQKIRILYGGSVKPGNAGEIFGLENVDGGLVGGASLKAEDFSQIVAAAG